MIVLRDPTWASRIAHPGIRSLVVQRFTEVCAGEAYTYGQHGYMVLVEPGDTVEQLEQETGCGITRDVFDETRYGEADFAPSFEILEEHDACYEMVFITSDSGFAVTLFIPKEDINADLLSMCAEFASPAIRTT